MADKAEEKKDQANDAKATEAKATEKDNSSSGSMLVWIIAAVVAVVGAGGGFFLANILASPVQQDQPEVEIKEQVKEDPMAALITEDSEKTYDHSLEPVVACLDEPSLSRYARATIILQMTPGFDPVAGEEFLKSKEAILTDWLTTYLAGLSLVQVQGSKNLERIKMEIFEQFNQLLFPDKKPLIQKILFKEFVVN